MDFKKVDAHTIEFSVTLQPDTTQDNHLHRLL
jgi:hypothetical protein